MQYKPMNHIVHGGDYNPDQWIKTKEIWDEDMRLMRLAHINSATVGIFSWAMLEPQEGIYTFEWLDEILDKLYQNGVSVILATPSGARPAWLAQKYPEVLRVEPSGIRNEFGIRHNHCLTSPIYREKVQNINRRLATRYKNHPAVKMWHISNEYCGECHCELCQKAFQDWLRAQYNNDLDALNDAWWNGFWAHQITDWSQIRSPKERGEPLVTALRLNWRRFVSDSHISFFENEIVPLREITPDIPITTNLMKMYDGIDYQKLARRLDVVSWDNYPAWDSGDNLQVAAETAFAHDTFRSMKEGQPFYMMESTPSNVNWFDVNKLPKPGMQELSAMQAIAHGADSVQYFQWRKSRGSHEKYHGAVVDHCGHENTRVFRETAHSGKVMEKLSSVAGIGYQSRAAIVYDWENDWAVKAFCGFNNLRRDYFQECVKWYKPFWQRGISADVISMDDDFNRYSLIVAPFLYMLKDGVEGKIAAYVRAGGTFVGTYLTGMVNKDDLCFLGGAPAGILKDVFGIWHEETDALLPDKPGKASYRGKEYTVNHVCDIVHATGAKVLGEYRSDFYAGTPAVTENIYGKGKAYYAAFRNDGTFADDLCAQLIKQSSLRADSDLCGEGIRVRVRAERLFVLNFSDTDREIPLSRVYTDALTDKTIENTLSVPACGYRILK